MVTTRNKLWLRSLCVVLSLLMLLSVTACGNKEPDDVNSTSKTDGTVSTAPTDPSSDSSGPVYPTDNTTADVSGDATTTTAKRSGNGLIISTGNRPDGSTKKTSVTSTTGTKATVDYGEEGDIVSRVPKKLSGQKIKVLTWWKAGSEDNAKAAYFKENTGINVSYEYITMSNYQTRLASMIMANNSPSLAAIINEWFPQSITRGLMQPIDVTGWDYTEDIYAQNMMNQFSYNGKQYGIALKGSTMSTFIVMFWNKVIFKQKGLTTTPETLWKSGKWNWDTCLDLAKKTTDASKKQYGLTLTYQYYWMLSAGQDFAVAGKSGITNNVKNADLLNAWNFSWDMINTHKVVDTSFTGSAPFYAGTAAMLAGGSFLMQADKQFTTYVPQNMKDDWGVVPFPSPAGKDPVAACEGTVWGFPKKISGDKLQAAAWYLRYFLDDKAYAREGYYSKSECWDVMDWMWKQKIQSYNSVGILSYGGDYTAGSVQFSLIDQSNSKAKLKSNLDSWYGVFDTNIKKITSEMN